MIFWSWQKTVGIPKKFPSLNEIQRENLDFLKKVKDVKTI